MDDQEKLLENDLKVYVDVLEVRRKDGTIIPCVIKWEDGRNYRVDKVLSVQPKATRKGGGTGIRYYVRVHGHETEMYLEEKKWFVVRDVG